jgi:DNA-binding sugar fermentation-stimulating protein
MSCEICNRAFAIVSCYGIDHGGAVMDKISIEQWLANIENDPEFQAYLERAAMCGVAYLKIEYNEDKIKLTHVTDSVDNHD